MDSITIMKILSNNEIPFSFRYNEIVITLSEEKQVPIIDAAKFDTSAKTPVVTVNPELSHFVMVVGGYLDKSGSFLTVSRKDNKIYCTSYDKRNILLIFAEDKLTIDYKTHITTYEWRDSFKLMETNFSCCIDHFVTMLITGFDFNIMIKSFDEFTLINKSIMVKHSYGTGNNYNVEFWKKENCSLSYDFVVNTWGFENCMKVINSYKS
jgi:hypothetical protein